MTAVTLTPSDIANEPPFTLHGNLEWTRGGERPVTARVEAGGELARIIEEHRCGIVVETADELAKAIRTLEANRDEAEAMGARGRALYLARFAPERAFAEWERVLSAC